MKGEGLMEQVQVHIFGDGGRAGAVAAAVQGLGTGTGSHMGRGLRECAANLKCFDSLLMPSYAESFDYDAGSIFMRCAGIGLTRTAGSEMLMARWTIRLSL